MRSAPLSVDELGALLTGFDRAVVHAIWLATGGRPGPARELAATVTDRTGDPVAELALRVPSRTGFLIPDVALIRLLETAAARPLPAADRSRVLIRLARELLGDPTSTGRRRELVDEAVALARADGDDRALARALDGRLHALWDPAAAGDRLTSAAEIVTLARRAGDAEIELRGLLWRFTALAELGDLDAAEAALVTYGRTGELLGDPEAAVVVLSRQAVFALARGELAAAASLTAEVEVEGRRAGLADTDRLTASLRGQLAMLHGRSGAEIAPLRELSRQLPGHFFGATIARALVAAGRDDEALLELERLLPAVLAGTGPRWLGAVADLAFTAARGGPAEAVRALYDTLLPFRGRLVVWGCANTITGPVDDLLGRLARRLGRETEALEHFDRAVAHEERQGALTWLAATLHARGRPGDRDRADSIARRLGMTLDAHPEPTRPHSTPPAEAPAGYGTPAAGEEWRLHRDGDDWILAAGTGTVRLRDVRGLHYLRALLAVPGQEIEALDLVAGGAGLRATPATPLLDTAARAAYRHRLAELDARLDAADRTGDAAGAEDVTRERTALLAHLRAATGAGGRPRRHGAEAERARINATRALSTVLTRLDTAAPLVALHLRASLRTGARLRYQPAPGGPARWRV